MIDLYKNIRRLREEQGLSQNELAKITGYTSRSSIAKIEKGEVDLPLSKIEIFANALKTTPSELMGDTWENDILNNARLDLVEYYNGDAYQIARFQENEQGDALNDLLKDPIPQNDLTPKDTKQIEKILQDTREKLVSQEGLMFDGDPASPEAIDSIINAMEIGMEMAKKKNKEKYTPKKYKKD